MASGSRSAIPAVYGRIVTLEEAAGAPGFASRTPEEITELLTRTAASQPVLSTRIAVAATAPGEHVVDALAGLAPATALTAAADTVRTAAPALAAVLDAAAQRAGAASGH